MNASRPIPIPTIKKEKCVLIPLASSFPPVVKDINLFKIHNTTLIKKSKNQK
jgi:hypothetical protein